MKRTKYFPRSKPLCRVSDPANRHTLYRRSDPPLSICFACKGNHLKRNRYYYYCPTCDLEFHRGCHLLPPKVRHPFHLLHPLTFTSLDPEFHSSEIPLEWAIISSDSGNSDADTEEDDDAISDGNHVKCKYCQRHLKDRFYHCSVCNFSLHINCALNSPPLTIENTKVHDHTLSLFHRRVPLPCDACGFSLDATWDPVYSCQLCNYVVHRKCLHLPRVIKITRHQHRLSHTASLVPSGEFSCGVCRKPVDVNYGQFSCNKGCHYAVHSKCATKNEVWDGKDLEGEPEEEEEDIEPFVRIDERTIQHFSHQQHQLKLGGNDNHIDQENKFCQACILPITMIDSIYSGTQCEFVLHGACANLPRTIHHPLHKHPLKLFHLSSSSPYLLVHDYLSKGFFKCNGCGRDGCGFMYKCGEQGCHFQLDARCASLLDSSIHDCHPHDHPLFFNLTKGKCTGCKSTRCSPKYLECIKCESFMGLRCATLPSVAHYKHDKHPLTLSYGEEETTDLQYWCEICETKLDATEWFYKCNSCLVTLHVTCLLGKEVYMKPNHIINISNETVDIARNNGNSRPMCDECKDRCVDTLVFKRRERNLCTLDCPGPDMSVQIAQFQKQMEKSIRELNQRMKL